MGLSSMGLSLDLGKQTATDAYKKGMPVIVFSADHKLLHGADDLEGIVGTQVSLDCTVLRMDFSVDAWNSSDWPEIFEAVRQMWLKDEL